MGVGAPLKRAHQALGCVQSPECVLQPTVAGSRVDVMREAQLADTTESLKKRTIKNSHLPGIQFDASPNRIIDSLWKAARVALLFQIFEDRKDQPVRDFRDSAPQ